MGSIGCSRRISSKSSKLRVKAFFQAELARSAAMLQAEPRVRKSYIGIS